MAAVREGRQRPQSDVTPHTAQLRWPANRPTGEWEDIQISILSKKIRKKLSFANI